MTSVPGPLPRRSRPVPVIDDDSLDVYRRPSPPGEIALCFRGARMSCAIS